MELIRNHKSPYYCENDGKKYIKSIIENDEGTLTRGTCPECGHQTVLPEKKSKKEKKESGFLPYHVT